MAKNIDQLTNTYDTPETTDDTLEFLLVTDNADTDDDTDDKSYLLRKESNKVFLQSENINVFPCSRRGGLEVDGGIIRQYDPEARLNTERTNRLHTATNGFTDSFIKSYDEQTFTLIFSLAGYYVEARNFDPAAIATALRLTLSNTTKIYAYLQLKTGVSLGVEDYSTEILSCQLTTPSNNYLDVLYDGTYTNSSDNSPHSINNYFFTGISFVSAEQSGPNDYNLPLFSYNSSSQSWELIQTSLLPKIEHGDTEESIKVNGMATITAITVPCNRQTTGDIDTTIEDNGIKTSYVYTKSLAADGISVGDEISIGDSSTKTTIGAGTVEAATSVTTPELTTNKITSDSGEGLTVEPVVTLDSTLTVEGLTTLEAGLTVANGALTVSTGDTTLQKLDAGVTTLDSLTVATDVLAVDTEGVDITGNLSVTGEGNSTSTPTLKVDTIEKHITDNITVSSPVILQDTLQVTKSTSTEGPAAKVTGSLEVTNSISTETVNANTLQSVNIVKTDQAQGLIITSTADSPERTLKIEGNTYTDGLTVDGLATLNDGLSVTEGATTLQALDAGVTTLDSLAVATDKFTVTNTAASFKVPVTITGDTNSVKTPALDVKTVNNTQDNTGVSIDDPLNITTGHAVSTDTLNVDNIESRATNGTIIAESPVKLNNTLEVIGDSTLKSNLKVEDNINVGTPAMPATADNGGYIVAKKDITAEQDLIAKRDIEAAEKATVKSLVVGERADTDSTDAGAITAKKEVSTPQLRVNRITSNDGSITIDNKKLIVNKSLEMLAPQPTAEKPNPDPAKATIEQAVIGDLTVEKKDTLKGSTGKITAKEMWLKDIGQIPVLELAHLNTTDSYQLRFKFGTSITIIEE